MQTKNNVSIFNKCANCGACYNACPTEAIKVVSDGLFYSLSVDNDICTSCGLCIKICPVNNRLTKNDYVEKSYYAVHKDDNVVRHSSSGGAFTAFAQTVLEQGGEVFSFAYGKDFLTVECKSSAECGLDDFRRSKYTESLVNYKFQEIKSELLSGKLVLFCGTPCQVAGLKGYLSKSYDNLITVDFICGGLSSHGLYQKMLTSYAKKRNVTGVNFRPKTMGWLEHSIKINFSNKKHVEEPCKLNSFVYGFYARLSLREYCYECKFEAYPKADITIADFWRYKELTDIKHDNKGLSFISVNSEVGEKFLNLAKERLNLFSLDQAKVSKVMPRREKVLNDKTMQIREGYFNAVKSRGLKKANKAYGKLKGAKHVLEKLKFKIKKTRYKMQSNKINKGGGKTDLC